MKEFSDIHLNSYFLLMQSLIPEIDGMVVRNSVGVQEWFNYSDSDPVLKELDDLFDKHRQSNKLGSDCYCRQLENSKYVFNWALLNYQHEHYGQIAFVINNEAAETNTSKHEALCRATKHISECIQNELSLSTELDLMALELSERYEELNLVYDTDDHVASLEDAETALLQLAENCSTYLDSRVVVLRLPDKKINIVFNNPSKPFACTSQQLEDILNNICKIVMADKDAAVINNNFETVDDGVHFKSLACPVIASNGNIAGALVTINDGQARDFSNSDRNLLRVMARKIAKIVQTDYDSLTGMLSRAAFEYELDKHIKAARDNKQSHCVFNIDIDQQRIVNNAMGYQAGDDLIKKIGEIIRQNVRSDDLIARTGGDEFGVFLEGCDLDSGERIAEKIRGAVAEFEFIWDGEVFDVTTSIGAIPLNAESESVESVLNGAEVACSVAKESGKNHVQVYQKESKDLSARKSEMMWVNRIKHALKEDRFIPYCQTIQPLKYEANGLHIEILLRLLDEEGKILSPFAFIPAAERYHLMPEIDQWVISKTLSVLSSSDALDITANNCISMNLSGQSLGESDFLEFVRDAVNKSSLPASQICFEITETAAIGNIDVAYHFITELKAMGCRFSLDDFGTGLSSFAYLKTLPVDFLKIDGSFVKNLMDDPTSEAMVAAINKVGQVMGIETVAEFVENDHLKNFVRSIGVDYAQGYGIDVPKPLDEYLNEWLDLTATSAEQPVSTKTGY